MMETQFAEGSMNLGAGTWFCLDHQITLHVGKECAFCVQESLDPEEFDRWLDAQS